MFIWFYSPVPKIGLHTTHVAPAKLAKVASSKVKGVLPKAKVLFTSHSGSHVQLSLPSNSNPLAKSLNSIPFGPNLKLQEPSFPTVQNSLPATFYVEPAQPTLANLEKLVNLNLSDTALATVVSILSKQTGVNAVLLTKTDQKVTINVKQMPLGEAFRHLAMLAGLKTLKVNNAIIFADDAALKSAYPKEYDVEYGVAPKTATVDANSGKTQPIPIPEVADVIQRIYSLKYQDATLVSTALKDYLQTKKVTITALPNTLLPNLANAGGVSIGGSSSSSGGSGSSAPAETRGKRILLSGPAAGVQETMTILQQMDVPRRQVEITVTIHDVSNDALKEVGISWDFGQTTVSEAVNGNANVGTFSRTGLSFVGTIQALEKAAKAKLLASPNISVMDGVQSSILIGEKRRFPVVTGTTANGQFIYSTEEQNVGIYLLVATDITDDGTVTLAINAQVSSILGFLQLNGGSYPQISTRESKSTLHLKDGQTMLMGGLLRDEDIVNLQKVPYLSQIPFFGELFKSRKTTRNSSQLLISITPHIIKQ